jgi:ADP-ribose pyrophosphatase
MSASDELEPRPFPPFEVAESQRIYDSPWCGLRRDLLRLDDGRLQEYHVFEVSDASVVVPVLDDGSIVMIGQHRHPHGKTHWEVPAGRIAAGESPARAAERELLEETGHAAREIRALPGFYPTNGISAHFAHAFVALGCRRVAEPEPDASERIVVRTFTRAQAEALLDRGRLQDGFTALALLYYLRWDAAGRFD